MNEAKIRTLEPVRAFLAGTTAVEFAGCGEDADRCRHIAEVLGRFGYQRLKKPDKGLILRYLESQAQGGVCWARRGCNA